MDKPLIINKLLDEAIEKSGCVSDYKLAQVLDLSKQKISALRCGSDRANAFVCTRIAMAIGKDPMEIIAMVESETAKNETQRAFWKSFKFSGMRNSLGLLLCGMLGFFGAGSHSGNAVAEISVDSHNGGIRKSQRRRHERRYVERRGQDRLCA